MARPDGDALRPPLGVGAGGLRACAGRPCQAGERRRWPGRRRPREPRFVGPPAGPDRLRAEVSLGGWAPGPARRAAVWEGRGRAGRYRQPRPCRRSGGPCLPPFAHGGSVRWAAAGGQGEQEAGRGAGPAAAGCVAGSGGARAGPGPPAAAACPGGRLRSPEGLLPLWPAAVPHSRCFSRRRRAVPSACRWPQRIACPVKGTKGLRGQRAAFPRVPPLRLVSRRLC